MGSIVCVDREPAAASALKRRGHAVTQIADPGTASAFFERPADLWLIHEAAQPAAALQLVTRIRGRQDLREIPIVFVTQGSDEAAVLRAYEAGASAVLTSPLSPAQLVVRTNRLLSAPREIEPEPNTEARFRPGTLWHGRYVLEREIGSGGTATVYRARDRKTGEAVAVKIAQLAEWDSESRERTAREAKSLAQVTCPQFPQLKRFSHFKGHDYMVLELIEGPTLLDYVGTYGVVDARTAVDLLLGLSLALYDLTEHGLVHRDLKPANVVLRDCDPADPVLVDFGLTRAPDQDLLTDPDILVGTIGYMAPEYVRGDAIGPRSDLFSLGHVLLFALTGERAFPGLHGFDLLQQLALETAQVPEHVPQPLSSLLQRLIEVDPDKRPDGPLELLEVLAYSVAHSRKWHVGR
ncbi:MAG: protein kinase [Planctomycetota bacterium]